MIEALVAGALVLLLALLVGVAILLRRVTSTGSPELVTRLDHFEKAQERTERVTRDEIAKSREEGTSQAKHLREEINAALKAVGDSAVKSVGEISNVQRNQLEVFSNELAKRTEAEQVNAKQLREEIGSSITTLGDSLVKSLGEIAALQKSQLEVFAQRLTTLTQSNEQKLDQMRQGSDEGAQKMREEMGRSLKSFGDSVVKSVAEVANLPTIMSALTAGCARVQCRQGGW